MVFLECLPDEVLVRRLGRTRRECRHHNDKGRVCNQLRKTERMVALIDEDPGAAQPAYLQELRLVEEGGRLRVLSDEKRGHRVLIVCPRLEEWVIETAKASAVEMEHFGLSDRGNTLHREITSRLPRSSGCSIA